jgi:CubicO group peptidase (beta-lactamase class C family)
MSRLDEFLRREIEEGAFPGGAALVGSSDAILEEAVAGSASVEPERTAADADTLWDLASLTKPLASAALARAAGAALPLDAPPGRFLPEWKRTRFDGITVESLLTHTSGLAAWFPLYVRGEGAAAYRRTLAELEPESRAGSAVVYSDLNFLLLAHLLETILSAPLDRAFAELIAAPAGASARFLPGDPSRAAATERGDRVERAMTARLGLSYAGFREGVVRGDVHDGNAFRRGGVSANAGLFGTARDVWTLARTWLEGAARPWVSDRTPELPESRGLGWQRARGAGSVVSEMSPESFGHTGFTGTSVWVDPERDRIAVLLTNRIHPTAPEANFHEVRKGFHGMVWGRDK